MRQKIKRSITTLYITIIIVMAGATFIEYSKGTEFASTHIYGSWWFCMLWAALAIATITYIRKTRMHSVTLLLLHSSFIVILTGALITHLFSVKGIVHLRKGITTSQYTIKNGMKVKTLPFKICLNEFNVVHPTNRLMVSCIDNIFSSKNS